MVVDEWVRKRKRIKDYGTSGEEKKILLRYER
jgi:hypothetical protein